MQSILLDSTPPQELISRLNQLRRQIIMGQRQISDCPRGIRIGLDPNYYVLLEAFGSGELYVISIIGPGPKQIETKRFHKDDPIGTQIRFLIEWAGMWLDAPAEEKKLYAVFFQDP